jgi:hypothetical protein
MIERGYFEANWAIIIKPVPRAQRHAVQTCLLERGLPFVKQWLIENMRGGRNGTAKMTYFWYEDEQRLGYEVEQRVQPERI